MSTPISNEVVNMHGDDRHTYAPMKGTHISEDDGTPHPLMPRELFPTLEGNIRIGVNAPKKVEEPRVRRRLNFD